jgi:hypothetical protein
MMDLFTQHFKALELIRQLIEKHGGRLEITVRSDHHGELYDVSGKLLEDIYDEHVEYDDDLESKLFEEINYFYEEDEDGYNSKPTKQDYMNQFYHDTNFEGSVVTTIIGASFPEKPFQYFCYREIAGRIEGEYIKYHEYGVDNEYYINNTTIDSSFERDNSLHLSHVYRKGIMIGVFCGYISKYLGEKDPTSGISY